MPTCEATARRKESGGNILRTLTGVQNIAANTLGLC